MHVAALLLADHVDQQWNTISFTNAPHYVIDVTAIPAHVVVPVVAIVWSEPGEDSYGEFQLVCFDGSENVLNGKRHGWDWPEQEGIPAKYHVYAHGLEIVADYEGLYYAGIGGDALGERSALVPFVIRVAQQLDEVTDPFIGG